MLSIICNSYNHEKHIQQCIEGFLIQKTTFPIEILIHDDCSTDNTPNIIREYETKYPDLIKPIYSKENLYSQGKKNILRQRQYGRAKGKYIAHCEGDDYWTDPYKLQKQVDFLEANLAYVLTSHRCKYYYEKENRFKTTQDKVFIDRSSIEFTIENFLDPFLIPMNSVVYRNNHETLSKTYKGHKDVFLFAQLLEKGKGICFNEHMSVYRIHSGGVWSLQKRIIQLKSNVVTSYNMNKAFGYKYKSIHMFMIYSFNDYIKELEKEKFSFFKIIGLKFKMYFSTKKFNAANKI